MVGSLEGVNGRNFPNDNLYKGDIATLINYVPHPEGGEEGAILEVFNSPANTHL